jgi:hypothetical protein
MSDTSIELHASQAAAATEYDVIARLAARILPSETEPQQTGFQLHPGEKHLLTNWHSDLVKVVSQAQYSVTSGLPRPILELRQKIMNASTLAINNLTTVLCDTEPGVTRQQAFKRLLHAHCHTSTLCLKEKLWWSEHILENSERYIPLWKGFCFEGLGKDMDTLDYETLHGMLIYFDEEWPDIASDILSAVGLSEETDAESIKRAVQTASDDLRQSQVREQQWLSWSAIGCPSRNGNGMSTADGSDGTFSCHTR